MFELKKALAYLLEPLTLTLGLLLLGMLLHSRRPRVALTITAFATAILLTLSLPLVAWWLGRGLEVSYAPIDPHDPAFTNVRTIVVLSGAYDPSPGRQIWDEMNSATLRRTIEGVRLARALPATKLILSGGDPYLRSPPASAMAQFAADEGIARSRILIERHSRDTADQAALLAPALGRAPFILVTSAYHLRRSCALFRRVGTTPLPAPTDYLSGDVPPDDIAPSREALNATAAALHEYLGLAWGRLRGLL